MYAAVHNSCASCALHLLKHLAMVNEGDSALKVMQVSVVVSCVITINVMSLEHLNSLYWTFSL